MSEDSAALDLRAKYIARRRVKRFMPVDPDAIPADFVFEGPDHPYVLTRSLTFGDGEFAKDLIDDEPEDTELTVPLIQATIGAVGLGGDWSLYAGRWDGQGWEPSEVTSAADARATIHGLFAALDREDSTDLMRTIGRTGALTEGEVGNSRAPSS